MPLDVHPAIKAALDPGALLNPGKVFRSASAVERLHEAREPQGSDTLGA